MTNEKAIIELKKLFAEVMYPSKEFVEVEEMAIKALEKQTQYERYLKVACELLMGAYLHGHDKDSIIDELLEKYGRASYPLVMSYIKEHIDELDD